MPELESLAIPSHQVLGDPTGRRRRRLAIAGRVATITLGVWLVVLILGGLGLQPLAGLPIVRHLGAGEPAPPRLPERVRDAVARRTTVAPGSPAVQAPDHECARPVVATGRRRTVARDDAIAGAQDARDGSRAHEEESRPQAPFSGASCALLSPQDEPLDRSPGPVTNSAGADEDWTRSAHHDTGRHTRRQ